MLGLVNPPLRGDPASRRQHGPAQLRRNYGVRTHQPAVERILEDAASVANFGLDELQLSLLEREAPSQRICLRLRGNQLRPQDVTGRLRHRLVIYGSQASSVSP